MFCLSGRQSVRNNKVVSAISGEYKAREFRIHAAAFLALPARRNSDLLPARDASRLDNPPFSPGQSVFNNYLNRAKVNYQFTKELSLRLILDYNATIANTNLVDVQRSLGGSDNPSEPIAPTKQFTTDVLLTYLLHPGTAVYLGYNNGFSDLLLHPGATPGAPPFVTAQGAPNNTNSRLFFVKVSYLLRF